MINYQLSPVLAKYPWNCHQIRCPSKIVSNEWPGRRRNEPMTSQLHRQKQIMKVVLIFKVWLKKQFRIGKETIQTRKWCGAEGRHRRRWLLDLSRARFRDSHSVMSRTGNLLTWTFNPTDRFESCQKWKIRAFGAFWMLLNLSFYIKPKVFIKLPQNNHRLCTSMLTRYISLSLEKR